MTVGPLPTVEQVDGVTVVTFDSQVQNISEDYLAAARETLLSVAGSQPPYVVLDLAGIHFFSSSFIEILFRIWKRTKANGGRFALCNVDKYCGEVLKITNLDSLWPIESSRASAFEVVKPPAA
jgi:anti-anti-sigma factor